MRVTIVSGVSQIFFVHLDLPVHQWGAQIAAKEVPCAVFSFFKGEEAEVFDSFQWIRHPAIQSCL